MAPPINKPKPEPWYPPGFVPPKPKVAADPEAKVAHANAPTERAAPAMTLEQRNKAFMADVASRSAVAEANKPFGAAKPTTSFADLREPNVIRESYLNKPEAAKPTVSIGPDAQSRARAEATAHAPSKSAGAHSPDGHKSERVADAGSRKPHVHVHPPVQPRSAFGEQLHAEAKEITRANGVVRSALAQDLHPDAIKAVVENRLQGHAKDVAMKMLDGANDTGTMAERLADSQKVASVLQATAAKARDPEHAQELVSAKLKGDMASSAGAIVANLVDHSHTKEQGSRLNAESLASSLGAGSASGAASAAVNSGMSASMSHGQGLTDSIGAGVSAAVGESVKTAAQASFGDTSSGSTSQSSSVTSGFSEGVQASVGQNLASSAAMLSGHSVGVSDGSSHSTSTQTSHSESFSASLGAVLAGSSSMSHSTGHSESMTQSVQDSVSSGRSAGLSEAVHSVGGSGTIQSSTGSGMTQSSESMTRSDSMVASSASEGVSSGSSRSASESHAGQKAESGTLLSEVRSNTEVYSDGSSVTQRSSTVSWTDAEGVHSNSRMETITQAAEHSAGESSSKSAGMSSSSSESMSSEHSTGGNASNLKDLASTEMGVSSGKSAGMSSSSSESMSAEHGAGGAGGAKGLASTDMSVSSATNAGQSTTASHGMSESRSMGESSSASSGLSVGQSLNSGMSSASNEGVSAGRESGEAQSARMAMSDAEASREVKTFTIEGGKSESVAHTGAEASSQARGNVPIEERSTFASAEPARAVPVEERSTFAEPGQHLASPGQSFFQSAVSSVVSKLPDSVAEVAQNGLEKAQAAFTSASEKVADTIHAAASAGSRVSLEDALAAHMRDKGFDAESIAAAGAIADAIRSESPDVKAESVIVLHRAGANGEPLATVVHAKDAASAAMAGDSVLALDTLDKIASQGMDSKSVAQLRSGMPDAVAGQSDLELAQITGPAKTALGGELNQAQEQTRQQEQNAQREAKQAESAQGREMAMAMQ